jgi:hypothetical protein
MERALRSATGTLDLLLRLNPEESDHRIRAASPFCSNPHLEGTGDTPGELLFVSLGGLWPG